MFLQIRVQGPEHIVFKCLPLSLSPKECPVIPSYNVLSRDVHGNENPMGMGFPRDSHWNENCI